MTLDYAQGRPRSGDLVNFADVAEIELRMLRRMKEYTLGDHGSVFHGTGVDFVGLRDWQAGDRMSSIDWPQSTPHELHPDGRARLRTTRHGADRRRRGSVAVNALRRGGVPIAAGIARAMATIGLSAVYFQDMFGMITSTKALPAWSALRPRVGRGHVIHCLDAYQGRVGMEDVKAGLRLATTIGGHLRRTALLPVISDFLFEDASERINELAELNSVHDVFLVMIDSAFAFELPDVSAGWINAFDVETGESRLMSRRELRRLAVACADGRTISSARRTSAVSTCCGSASIRKRACPRCWNSSWCGG